MFGKNAGNDFFSYTIWGVLTHVLPRNHINADDSQQNIGKETFKHTINLDNEHVNMSPVLTSSSANSKIEL